MLERLTKTLAFWKAPKKTYVGLHPWRAAGIAGIAGSLVAAKLVFDRVRR